MNFKSWVVALFVAVPLFSLGTPTPAQAHFHVKGGKECRMLSYQWGTDWASFDIKAKRVPCWKVRRWLWADKGGWDQIDYRWWRCRKRIRNGGDRFNGISHTDFKCVGRKDPRRQFVWANS
jgi:hypothetical protein